MLICYPYSY